jgi:hypothetical protein
MYKETQQKLAKRTTTNQRMHSTTQASTSFFRFFRFFSFLTKQTKKKKKTPPSVPLNNYKTELINRDKYK